LGCIAASGRCHPSHIGLVAVIEPTLQGFRPQLEAGTSGQARDSNRIKAFLLSPLFQSLAQGFELIWVLP
jgi:hypothetical protein